MVVTSGDECAHTFICKPVAELAVHLCWCVKKKKRPGGWPCGTAALQKRGENG